MSDAEMTQHGTPKKRRVAKWEKSFIATLAECGNVSEACRKSDTPRRTVYNHRETHEDFAQAWDIALDIAADTMELEARRRAVEGVDEPVYQKGLKVGTIRRYSDTLLIFLLKAARPEKFRERFEVANTGDKPFKIYIQTSEFNPDDA